MRQERTSWQAGPNLVSGRYLGACAAILLAGCSTAPLPAPILEAPPSARAGTAPVPPTAPAAPLTITAAIRRATACSAQIAALQAAVAVAEQRRRAATDVTDPELQLTWAESTVDGLRQRSSLQQTESGASGEQTSTSLQSTTGNTTESDGTPKSVYTTTQTTTGDSTSSSRGTQTQSSSTLGHTTEDADGFRIGVRLFVPNPWLLTPRVAARNADIQAARADLRNAEWLLACDVRRLYTDIAYLTNTLVLAAELVGLDGAVLKAVRSRADQGAATTPDLLAATRRHLQLQNNLDQARQRCRLAQRELAALLNLPVDALEIDAVIAAPPVDPSPTLPVDRIERRAMQNRADLTALHWRVLAARSAYREARNVRYPWIKEIDASYRTVHGNTLGTDTTTGTSSGSDTTLQTATGTGQSQKSETFADSTVENTSETRTEQGSSVTRKSSGSSDTGNTWIDDHSDASEWQIGFAMDVPIFSWIKNHADAVLLAQFKLAGALETAGLRLVSQEVRAAVDELEESRRQQARYDSEVQPLIAEMRQTLKVMEGTPSLMPDQVASARMQMVETATLELECEHRYAAARVALERAIGAPLAEVLK